MNNNFKAIVVIAATALQMSVGYAAEANESVEKSAPVAAYVVSGSSVCFQAFSDLQAAFDHAQKGDTVYIMAGDYPAVNVHEGQAKVQRMEGSEGAIVINGHLFEGVMLAAHCKSDAQLIAKN